MRRRAVHTARRRVTTTALTHVVSRLASDTMTRRLQVRIEDDELHEIQRLARRRRLTTAEWVRRALRTARDAEAGASITEKLASVRIATSYAFPTADIDTMLSEIERG